MKVTVLNHSGRYDGEAEIPDYIIDAAERLESWMKSHGVAQIGRVRTERTTVLNTPHIITEQWSSYRD